MSYRTDFLINRGYTMHEHINGFGLINMNGRVYDPKLGRFLSPDPILQDPSSTQNMNRYSYVLNNPLKYIDPSGYYNQAAAESVDSPQAASANWYGDSCGGYGGRGGGRMGWSSGTIFNGDGSINYYSSLFLEDYVQGSTGNWVSRSELNSNIVSQNSSSRGKTILNYLQAGFDINFVNNGTANYALAIDGGVTKGSAAGIIWNASFSDSGLHIGFNKGVNSFSIGASNGGGEDYSLFFNGKTLSVMQGDNTVYSTVANSGKGEHMNNPNSQKVSNLGPLPEGNYFFYNQKWNKQSKLRQAYNIIAGNGDWGDYNVPLNYISSKGPRPLRYGFYLHGGIWPGSAGCIDAGGNVGDVYNYVRNQNITYLRVQY